MAVNAAENAGALEKQRGSRIIAPNRPAPALFVTDRRYNGTPKRMSNHGLESVTKTVGKRAGLDKNLTVHVFRRTFATRLADAGCPLEVIQELMGHSKPETTQRYIAKSQARVVQSAARYFNAA